MFRLTTREKNTHFHRPLHGVHAVNGEKAFVKECLVRGYSKRVDNKWIRLSGVSSVEFEQITDAKSFQLAQINVSSFSVQRYRYNSQIKLCPLFWQTYKEIRLIC